MVRIQEIFNFIEELAPPNTALDWDNCGLQVDSEKDRVKKVLLALDMSPETINEAENFKAELIITHHPLIFSPLKSIRFNTLVGELVGRLIKAGIAHFAAHTNLDRSYKGTGFALAELLKLKNIQRYTDDENDEMNMVITGEFENSLDETQLVDILKNRLNCREIKLIGKTNRVKTLAILPGSGGSLLGKLKIRYDLIITGEASYHHALTARQEGLYAAVIGHYYSEKPVMHNLKKLLTEKFPRLQIRVSTNEGEPYRIM